MAPMCGMIQRGQQPRLAVEANAPLGIGREEAREDFDRDIAPELAGRGRGTPRPCRPTPSGAKHFVMREAVPDQQRGRRPSGPARAPR